MGVAFYNRGAGTIGFVCPTCKENGQESLRTIPISDIELVWDSERTDHPDFKVFAKYPLCTCGTQSMSFFGTEVLNVPGHIRALLLKKLYTDGGGDSNADLAPCKTLLNALQTSYANTATEEAKGQFADTVAAFIVDSNSKPIK
jgi:hypothetical protein